MAIVKSSSTRHRTRSRRALDSDEMQPIKEAPHPKAQSVLAGVDKTLLYVTVALSCLGLMAVFSASAMEAMDKFDNGLYFVQRQAIFFVLGFAMMIGVSRVPYFKWSKGAKLFSIGVIGLLLYTLSNGVEAYGAERWIRIGGFQFQPSELSKISVVLLLAQTLSQSLVDRARSGLRNLSALANVALIGLTVLLILKQPNLSMTIILSSVTGILLFIAGVPLLVLGVGGVMGGFVVAHKIMTTPYQLRRIQGWLDPWKDAQDSGYNLIQSLFAIGSGGLFGAGLGMSHQKLYYLPFQYTDFIFSVWAEEWGFMGCLILLGLFFMLLYRGYVIAKTCRSAFGQVLAMGITLMFAVQIIINVFVATGLFPVTGVTLPLISYGGTSVLVTLIMIGMLLNISRYRVSVSQIRSR